MHFTKASLIAILVAVVGAQSPSDLVPKIPACAQSCLITAIQGAGCGITDFTCQCTTQHNTILAQSAGCISKACSTSDILTTTDITNQICALATGGGASSKASSATSVVSSAGSSAAPAASHAGTTTAASGAPSSGSNTSTAAATRATTNAGNIVRVGAGILGAAVVAALAL